MAVNLTPKFFTIIPAREKLELPISFRDEIEWGADKPEEGATRSKTFYQNSAPTGGYKPGDIWVDTDDNKHTYRANDSMVWISIRDGTIAVSQAAADAAQAAASAAQSDATANDALLDDIADDAKITPVEKLTIKPLWDAIVAEKVDIDAEADTFGVSKTAYGTAYDNLDTYLNTTLDVFNDMTATEDITRGDWDGFWEAYFNAKIEILNAISTAAKALADAAAATADWFGVSGEGTPEDYATLQTSIEKTTGENIAIRNVLSMGYSGEDMGNTVTEDAWADQANAATNYGDSAQMRVGSNDAASNACWGYVKVLLPSGITNSDISSVVIRFQVAGGSLTSGNAITFKIYRLTAAPDEDTITWNAKPANDAALAGSSSQYSSIPGVGTWVEIDITQLFKDWNDNTYDNYGVVVKYELSVGGANAIGYFNFYTKEAGGSIQAQLVITGWADKTKVYKADANSWEGVMQIVGFAREAKASGNAIKIQTRGPLGGFSGLIPGADYYVDTTAGRITVTPQAAPGRKKIGKAISTTELDIDLDPPLEYVGIAPVSVAVPTNSSWSEEDISAAVPKRAKIADFAIRIRAASKIAGVRKTDSGINRYLTCGAGGNEMLFFNMPAEITNDVDGSRHVEIYGNDSLIDAYIVGYWI